MDQPDASWLFAVEQAVFKRRPFSVYAERLTQILSQYIAPDRVKGFAQALSDMIGELVASQ
jgi:hypothetical protein